ncbi:hypothetical protein ACFLSQ_05935 [Bacteroidota bacterium]
MNFKITIILIIAALFISITPNNLSAAKTSYAEAITIDPLNFLLNGIINAKYEQKLSKNNSFTVGGVLFYDSNKDGKWLGVGLSGSYRWYFDLFKTRKKPLQGFSVGPRVTISHYSFTPDKNVGSDFGGVMGTIGGEAMYKWVWDNFVLETGIVLNFPILEAEGSNYSAFGLNASIGYAW